MVYKLPQSALSVIDSYLKLKAAEDKYVRCPYFRNPKSGRDRWGLTAYSGKGSPQEIEDELRIIEKLEDADFSKMQESQIRDIMRKRRLGIECSGFITRILDGWTREIYKKPIYSLIKFNKGGLGKLYSMLRPYTHIDVEILVHPDNAREIIRPQELMPGDLIRFNTTIDHVIIVTSTERDEDLKKARYAHSILEDDGEGIKLGSIEFVNADKNDLLSQKWSEEPQTGRVISDKGEPKVYRLRVVENYPKKII